MNHHRRRIIDSYINDNAQHFDPNTNLLCGDYLDRYTCDKAYLEKYFDVAKIDDKSLRSFRESSAYAFYLLFAKKQQEQANRIITAVLQAQVKDAEHTDHGQMRWFFEEKKVRDGNGNFFIGAPLLLIHNCFHGQLSAFNSSAVEKALSDLYPVFSAEKKRCSLTYVNPTLGIKSLSYLLAKRFVPHETACNRTEIIEYLDFLYRQGINESYTPTYYGVSIIILFMLILLDEDERVSASVWRLLNDVMLKEKAFFADRFPAPYRRGYNSTYTGAATDILSFLFGYIKDFRPQHYDMYLPCMALPLTLMVEEKFKPEWPRFDATPRLMRGVVFGDCWAESYADDEFLLGSFSHFPPLTAVWQTVAIGGAGWQDSCFFLSLQSENDCTGILRLEATDHNGKETFHPLREDYSKEAADRIFEFLSFPPEPKVRTLQHAGKAICLWQINRVDAELQKFGFNLLFSRFEGRVYDRELRELTPLALESRLSSEAVILETANVWICLFPLSRVDMLNSTLTDAAFYKSSFEIFFSGEGLNCALYNYQGPTKRFTQNHITGGFAISILDRKSIPGKNKVQEYVRRVDLQEQYYSEHINAHIDQRDSVRMVSFADGDDTLLLEWDLYTDTEPQRRVNGELQKQPEIMREILCLNAVG